MHDSIDRVQIGRRGLLVAGWGLLLAACTSGGYSRRPYPWPRQQPPAQNGISYTVVDGDSLASIARRTGLSVRDLMVVNRLSSTTIVPGQRLWLPGVTGIAAAVVEAEEPAAAAGNWPRGYTIIPRRQWTTAAIGPNHYQMKSILRITVHHTGEYAGMVGLKDIDIVRRIDHYHRTGRKWAAIGYHYLIGRDGRIYQGRPESIQGAHTSGANQNNLGISVMGDFSDKLPNSAQVTALRNFLEDTRRRLNLGRSRVFGHRDLSASTCPGDRLYAWLRTYKAG